MWVTRPWNLPVASSANHGPDVGHCKDWVEARRLAMWTGRRAARAALWRMRAAWVANLCSVGFVSDCSWVFDGDVR